MKHSSSLAIWLGLGAAFLGLLTTLFAVLVAQRKKAAATKQRDGLVQQGGVVCRYAKKH